jgi:hypothetical protein
MALYRILEGVHRCVAAREAGLNGIRAQIDRQGILSPVEVIPLDSMYSPKREIGRWDRNRDFFVLVGIMQNEAQRESLDPVILSSISARTAGYFTRVANVVVNPI